MSEKTDLPSPDSEGRPYAWCGTDWNEEHSGIAQLEEQRDEVAEVE